MKVAAIGVIMIISVVLMETVALPQASTPEAVLAQMQQSNMKYPFIQAKVTQTIYKDFTGAFDDPKIGKISIARSGNAPRQIKVEFDKPVKEVVYIDKGMLKRYFPNTKAGQTYTFNKEDQPEGECIFLGLCQDTARIKQFYKVNVLAPDVVAGVKTTVLELIPKDAKRAEEFKSIKLWLDAMKGYPIQTRLYIPNGNYRNILFTEISTKNFSTNIFKFDFPKDADVQVIKRLE